ncbi:MAG: HD domain-containing protein [Chloroflexi bacterium]|nr:MAG: HD domain-containing protein [Chloroflexota bacterium]MBL1194540.1 HD domain-containing protein [Chloroflexota bacterium]NOH11828.1 HD domain-containing protein [Chloroflexota bacterium]
MLGERFEQALSYAAQLHRQQKRKASQVPYIAHLMSVTALVLEDGGSEDEAIAALLHDAVEDQGGQKTLDYIQKTFGEEVAEIVEACTDAYVQPKPPWEERKRQHIEHTQHAAPSVQRVVLADKVHNARAIVRDLRMKGPEAFDVFRGGREGTLWYYRSMLEALVSSPSAYLLDELRRLVSEMETSLNA